MQPWRAFSHWVAIQKDQAGAMQASNRTPASTPKRLPRPPEMRRRRPRPRRLPGVQGPCRFWGPLGERTALSRAANPVRAPMRTKTARLLLGNGCPRAARPRCPSRLRTHTACREMLHPKKEECKHTHSNASTAAWPPAWQGRPLKLSEISNELALPPPAQGLAPGYHGGEGDDNRGQSKSCYQEAIERAEARSDTDRCDRGGWHRPMGANEESQHHAAQGKL